MPLMSEIAESKLEVETESSALEIPIANMEPGFFWARFRSIGLSIEEGRRMSRGELSPARAEELATIFKLAQQGLQNAEVPGVQFWMSPKRILS